MLGSDAGAKPRSAVMQRVPATIAEATTLAVVLAAAGLLFSRGRDLAPSFDEGVYLGQLDALVHGQRLGTDVFAAQPPGFYWLLRAAGWLGGLGVDQIRVAVLVLALAGVVFAYAIGRFVAGAAGGLAAAAALAVVPAYGASAARVSADLPGMVLALASLACLLAPRRRVTLLRVALAGVLFAFAELVKLDAFIVVLPVALAFALRHLHRKERIAPVVAAALTLAAAAAVLGNSIGSVWRGAVSYHVKARAVSPGDSQNVHQLGSFFHPRHPFTSLAVLAVLAALAYHRRTRCLWPFWLATALAVGFVLWHRPIHDNHIVLLAVAASLAVGVTLGTVLQELGRARAFAIAAVVALVAAGYVQDTRQMRRDAQPVPARMTWAAARIAALTPRDSLVISDEPLVPLLAHRRMPGETIDTALLRFEAGYLDDPTILRAAARVRAVVVGRSFLSRPQLVVALAHRFRRVATRDGLTLYVR